MRLRSVPGLFTVDRTQSPVVPARPGGPTSRLGVEELGDRIVPASLWVGDATVVEGNNGTTYAEVRVSLDTAVRKTVSVNYSTTAGTASAGADYSAGSGKLTFARGEMSKTILIPVLGDRLAEANENFVVRLGGASGAKIADRTGVVTILDNEPRITIGGVSAYKGDSGSTPFTFTVSLSAAYDEAVTVNYATLDGTAVAGVDYLAAAGTLTFAPGETTRTITIEVIGDVVAGVGNKSFFVSLNSASTNAMIGSGFAEGIILDPDYDNSDTTNYWGNGYDYSGTYFG